MRSQLTYSIEDYLKAIYDICATQGRASTPGRATTNQIAEVLEITPASVTGMLKKLAGTEPPLVEYQKHRGASLTPAGEKVALEIIRHHRLLEMFLHQILGYDWDEVHAEADRLEHVISEDFEERIAAALGNPNHDPHGDPIPTRELTMPESSLTSLYDLQQPGQCAVITRVRDSDSNLLRYLSEHGLNPQAALRVLEYNAFDDNLRLAVEGQAEPVTLGAQITRQIFVEVLEKINSLPA